MENKKMTRKEELLKQSYGTLQSTEEYKYYLDNFVYNQSKNMTSEISYILKQSYEENDTPLSYEDLENEAIINYDKLRDELSEDDKDYKNFLIENSLEGIDTDTDFQEEDEENLRGYLEERNLLPDYEEMQEVYQWFIMDDRLLYQLKERGEVILNNEYWGRCCCGQSIELDSVIIDIFKEWFLNLVWIEEKFKLNEVKK